MNYILLFGILNQWLVWLKILIYVISSNNNPAIISSSSIAFSNCVFLCIFWLRCNKFYISMMFFLRLWIILLISGTFQRPALDFKGIKDP
jgi:hypothetical protein